MKGKDGASSVPLRVWLDLSNKEQRNLITSWLREGNYQVNSLDTAPPILAQEEVIELLVLDVAAAGKREKQLHRLKEQAARQFRLLPTLILVPAGEDSSRFLRGEFDDVLPEPVSRELFLARLDLWRRLATESVLQLRPLFENTTIGLYRTTPDGRILLANPALVKMLGYKSLADLKQRNLEREGFEPGYERVLFKAQLEREGVIQGLESAWTRRDGSVLWVRESAYVVRDEISGEVLYYEGTVEDITERKQAELRLKASEEKYRDLYENAPAAMFSVNTEGKIVRCNQKAAELLGYDRKELIGIPILDLYAPNSNGRPRAEKAFQKFKSGETIQDWELQMQRKNGRPIWISLTVNAIRDSGGRVVESRSMVVDISRRKAAELAMAESELRFRTLANASREAIVIHDHGRLLDANKAFLRLFGYTWRQALPLRFYDFFPPQAHRIVEKHSQGDFTEVYEIECIRRDGSIFEGEIQGHTIPYHGRQVRVEVIRDISRFKASQRIIQQQKDELEAMLKAVPVPLFILDEKLSIRGSNMAALEYCNLATDEMLGRPAGEALGCIHNSDDPRGCGFGPFCQNCGLHQSVDETKRTKQPVLGTEAELEIQNDGVVEKRFVRLNTAYYASPAGTRILLTLDDFTLHHDSEMKLKRLSSFNASLVEGMGEGIIVLDANGFITYVNPATERLLGYSLDELRRQHWSLLVPPEEQEQIEQEDQRRKEGHTSIYETQLLRKDGSRLVVRVSGTPRFENGEYVGTLAVFTDITEQKRAQRALEASETRFRSIFESLIDVYYRQDMDGRLTLVSPSVKRYGYEPEDLVGRQASEFYYRDTDREEVQKKLETEGEVRDFEVRLKDSRGRAVWFSVNIKLLRDSQGQPVGIEGLLRDIHERKRAESKLRNLLDRLHANEKQLRTIIETEPECVKVLNRKGEVVLMNKAGLAILDVEKLEDIQGRPVLPFVKRGYRASFQKLFKRNLQGYSGKLTFQMVSAKGKVRWMETHSVPYRDHHNRIVGVLAVTRDITGAKEIEAALKESEAKYSSLFQHSKDALLVHDFKGRILEVNQRAVELFGYSANEFTALTMAKLYPVGAKSKLQKMFGEVRKSGFVSLEVNFQKKNGEIFPAEVSAGSISFGGRTVIQCIVRDITERKRAEETIKELNRTLEEKVRQRTAQLEASNRELKAFAYSVSHDLRSPLVVINGFSEILMQDYGELLGAEGRRLLETIRANTMKMDNLISDILALSRASTRDLEMKLLDMKELAYSAWEEVTSPEERGSFEFIIKSMPKAIGDPTLIRQVWVNFLSNSVKYTRPQPTKRIEVGGYTKNAGVEYYVKDSGIGFDPQHAGQLFQAFHRLHSEKEFQGTGVGLAIVERIVRRHGGTVRAEGRPGQGAVFYFWLPNEPNQHLE